MLLGEYVPCCVARALQHHLRPDTSPFTKQLIAAGFRRYASRVIVETLGLWERSPGLFNHPFTVIFIFPPRGAGVQVSQVTLVSYPETLCDITGIDWRLRSGSSHLTCQLMLLSFSPVALGESSVGLVSSEGSGQLRKELLVFAAEAKDRLVGTRLQRPSRHPILYSSLATPSTRP